MGVQTEDKTKKDKFVLSVAYSSDGLKLACGCMDGTVAIFDVNTGSLLSTCAGHFKPVRSVAFTPGGPWTTLTKLTKLVSHAMAVCVLFGTQNGYTDTCTGVPYTALYGQIVIHASLPAGALNSLFHSASLV